MLDEELEQLLKTLPLNQRRECLEALAAEFPVPSASDAPANAGTVTTVTALPNDPAVVADHLVSLLRGLPPEQTAAISRQLQGAGLVASGGSAQLDVPPELAQRIERLMPSRTLDPKRALRALDILLEFLTGLDQIVWQVWKNIAPRTIIQHETGTYRDLRTTIAAYLVGDGEVSTDQVKQLVGKTRKLTCGLLAAMGSLGEIHTAKLLERLSPEAIKKAAGTETSVFESSDRIYWRKYNTIFSEMKPEVMEREILEAIRKYTEKLVLGAEAANALDE